MKMGPRDCPETSVNNYQSTSRNIPQERRRHSHGSGSLKSCKRVRSSDSFLYSFLAIMPRSTLKQDNRKEERSVDLGGVGPHEESVNFQTFTVGATRIDAPV